MQLCITTNQRVLDHCVTHTICGAGIGPRSDDRLYRGTATADCRIHRKNGWTHQANETRFCSPVTMWSRCTALGSTPMSPPTSTQMDFSSQCPGVKHTPHHHTLNIHGLYFCVCTVTYLPNSGRLYTLVVTFKGICLTQPSSVGLRSPPGSHGGRMTSSHLCVIAEYIYV